MRYRNPVVEEPVPPDQEGRDFWILIGVVLAALATLTVVLVLLGGWIASHIPFETEQGLVSRLERGETGDPPAKDRAAQAALDALGARVVAAMDLPPGMSVRFHYQDSDVVNAGATLGGKVFVYRGLIAKLDSEDALAAVIAHEVGHVRHRHVVRGVGRGMALVVALGTIGINSTALNRWALQRGTQLTLLSFSRAAEREADAAALQAVQRLYGHVQGLGELFEALGALDGGQGIEVLRTHPLSVNRQREVLNAAAQLGYATTGELTAMPATLSSLASRRRASP